MSCRSGKMSSIFFAPVRSTGRSSRPWDLLRLSPSPGGVEAFTQGAAWFDLAFAAGGCAADVPPDGGRDVDRPQAGGSPV